MTDAQQVSCKVPVAAGTAPNCPSLASMSHEGQPAFPASESSSLRNSLCRARRSSTLLAPASSGNHIWAVSMVNVLIARRLQRIPSSSPTPRPPTPARRFLKCVPIFLFRSEPVSYGTSEPTRWWTFPWLHVPTMTDFEFVDGVITTNHTRGKPFSHDQMKRWDASLGSRGTAQDPEDSWLPPLNGIVSWS